MGQYHMIFNLDKQQCLDPHKLGAGLKLWEQVFNAPSTGGALLLLLSTANGRGSGDFVADDPHSLIGSWAGDRIVVAGDYEESGDYEGMGFDSLYDNDDFHDISMKVRALFNGEGTVTISGGGWASVKWNR